MPDKQRGKLDAKGKEYLSLDYCDGTKAYRLMCLQTKNVIKIRDVVFMKHDMSFGNILEIRPSGRNEGPTAAIMKKSSKSSLFNDIDEQVKYHLVANEKKIKIIAENDNYIENMEDISKGSGIRPENSGRITFHSNTAKNGRMWHCWIIL